ncbi:glycoside hydrolase family 16 protein [Rickenella mellea]|uniref:Glycoside hydrolase family 16 protein n=1 Tax=Rickenella mellea TaxID=50990 RepID=A0A4Y7QHL0_9AGAM|nr:glycoside hydrolase family 16 protein [Rickenella mellea]
MFLTNALISSADTVVLPATSFDCYSTLEQYWAYLYPWGSDHNGSARMVGNSSDHKYISVSEGVLTLSASPVSGQPPSTSNPYPAIHYFSGTVHANVQINVDGIDAVGYQVEGEFISPTATGTWPAIWLTAVNGWPPEADIGEWKGTEQNWFNTFRTANDVSSTIVPWPTDGNFHSVKAVLRAVPGSTSDLTIAYYLDDVLQAIHNAAGFMGQAMWLYLSHFQMEGSSGSPGPSGTTIFQARNVIVTKLTS